MSFPAKTTVAIFSTMDSVFQKKPNRMLGWGHYFFDRPPPPSLEILGFSLNLGNSISSKPPLFVLLKKNFLKTLLLEFLIFLLYSWSYKFPRKQSSTPGYFTKLCVARSLGNFKAKTKTPGNPTLFFLGHP